MSIIFEGLRRESATPPDVDTRGALKILFLYFRKIFLFISKDFGQVFFVLNLPWSFLYACMYL